MNKICDVVVLVAYPLGGKDTQSKLLMEFLDKKEVPFLYVATGNEFRTLGESNFTASLIKKSMDGGSLVPDFLATGLVVNSLVRNLSEDKLLILNGFPRSKKQGEQFLEMMDFYGRSPRVVFIKTSPEDLMKRMGIRKQSEQRSDDTEVAVKNRFDVFRKENTPLIHFLQSHLPYLVVDGSGTPEEVHERVLKALCFVE